MGNYLDARINKFRELFLAPVGSTHPAGVGRRLTFLIAPGRVHPKSAVATQAVINLTEINITQFKKNTSPALHTRVVPCARTATSAVGSFAAPRRVSKSILPQRGGAVEV